MGQNNMKKGETVSLNYFANIGSGTVTVFDVNGISRPIQKWERLILDSVTWGAYGDTSTSGVVLQDSLTNANLCVLAPGVAVGALADTHTFFAEFPGEGVSLSVGATVVVVALSAGSDGGVLVGTARIVNGTTQGVRPNYQCLLTPGGNLNGI